MTLSTATSISSSSSSSRSPIKSSALPIIFVAAAVLVKCVRVLVVMELPVFSLPSSSFWDADARVPKNLAAVVVVATVGGGLVVVVVLRCLTGGGCAAAGAGAIMVELDRSAAWTGGAGTMYCNGSSISRVASSG